jgi:hypothetical protein
MSFDILRRSVQRSHSFTSVKKQQSSSSVRINQEPNCAPQFLRAPELPCLGDRVENEPRDEWVFAHDLIPLRDARRIHVPFEEFDGGTRARFRAIKRRAAYFAANS